MSMYKTSEEGLRKISQNTFRDMTLKELEYWARNCIPHEELLFVVEETAQKIRQMYSSRLEEKVKQTDWDGRK